VNKNNFTVTASKQLHTSTYVNQPTNNTVTMFVSGARNFATGVKNQLQKLMPVFWCRFLERVSLA